MTHAWRIWLALAVLLFAASSPAGAQWRRAESPHFVVYSEAGDDELRAFVQELEDFDGLLRQLTGLQAPPSPNKLQVYFVRGAGQLRRIRPVGGAAGFYSATPDGILATVDHGLRQDWLTHGEILRHEYAHHFMLQYFPASYPLWYVEGFAEYVATVRMTPGVLEIGRYNSARASWLADRSGWLPFNRMLFGDPATMGGSNAAKFYAQSWLTVHYMMRDADRRRRLAQYLAAVAQGAEPQAAFTAAFQTNPSALQRAVSAYASSEISFTRITRDPGSAAAAAVAIEITPLTGTSDNVMLAQAALSLTVTDRPEAVLAQVRQAAAGRTDAVAQRVLARAEALYGDAATADRLLEPLIAAAPQDAELLYLKGMRHLVAGRRDAAARAEQFREAQRWFVRAHRADENHFPTLYRYAEALSLEPGFPSENTLNVVLLAQQLAPQVEEFTLTAANLLMRRGDFDRAASLLRPMASGHDRLVAALAQALLAKATARDNRQLPDPFAVARQEG